jgi:hypothetical protein
MATRIDKLTPAQAARMSEWVDKWTSIGLSTDPANFDAAFEAALRCYDVSKLTRPRGLVRAASPLGAHWGGAVVATVLGKAENVESNVESNVWSNVESNVWSNVWSNVESNVGSNVWSNVRSNVESNVWSNVRSNVVSNVESNVWSNVRSNVRSNVVSNVWSNVESNVGSNVWSNVVSNVSNVRSNVESNVESNVWSNVESNVESNVWSNVESNVWSNVESNVESNVWSNVESNVWSGIRNYRSGQFWASWFAYVTFFRDVCGWENQTLDAFALDEALGLNCGWVWWHDDVVAISDRPHRLRRDNVGRLHNDSGAAIEYRDGWGVCAWHGYRLPETHEWIVRDRDKLSATAIDNEGNAELRRIMLEAFGFDRYLGERGAKEIAVDTCHGRPRRLLDITVKGETVRVIEVENGSLEPDGTRRKFVLGAARHPITRELPKTPHEAIAWSYGRPADQYVEAVRT